MYGALPWIVSLTVIILDQLVKSVVSGNLYLGQSLPVIKNIFHITLVHNTGVAFGLFKNLSSFFILVSAAVILYILKDLLINHRCYSLRKKIAFSLVLGGACGNLIDRFHLGYIVDFLDFRIWPVFNIADSAITIGIFLLAIELFFARSLNY